MRKCSKFFTVLCCLLFWQTDLASLTKLLKILSIFRPPFRLYKKISNFRSILFSHRKLMVLPHLNGFIGHHSFHASFWRKTVRFYERLFTIGDVSQLLTLFFSRRPLSFILNSCRRDFSPRLLLSFVFLFVWMRPGLF